MDTAQTAAASADVLQNTGEGGAPVVRIPHNGGCPVCGFGRSDHRRRGDLVPGRDVWQCRQWNGKAGS